MDNDSLGDELQEISDRLSRLEEAFVATSVRKSPRTQKAASVAEQNTATARTTTYTYTVDKDGDVIDDIYPSAQTP